ncbi:hypothetical protein ACFXG4_21425 [Nocardia sp. NPDC059246]|uniref:hypothetical protein n=1 Tax=unclassified Nocardia TaxID=2637762 RepID=UPI00369B6475
MASITWPAGSSGAVRPAAIALTASVTIVGTGGRVVASRGMTTELSTPLNDIVEATGRAVAETTLVTQ